MQEYKGLGFFQDPGFVLSAIEPLYGLTDTIKYKSHTPFFDFRKPLNVPQTGQLRYVVESLFRNSLHSITL